MLFFLHREPAGGKATQEPQLFAAFQARDGAPLHLKKQNKNRKEVEQQQRGTHARSRAPVPFCLLLSLPSSCTASTQEKGRKGRDTEHGAAQEGWSGRRTNGTEGIDRWGPEPYERCLSRWRVATGRGRIGGDWASLTRGSALLDDVRDGLGSRGCVGDPWTGPQGGIFRSGGKDWAFLTWAALWAEHVLCVRVVSEAQAQVLFPPQKKRLSTLLYAEYDLLLISTARLWLFLMFILTTVSY
jgi:hypothetical protein